MTGTSPA